MIYRGVFYQLVVVSLPSFLLVSLCIMPPGLLDTSIVLYQVEQ
jgi:hypothetical protein